MKSKVGVIPFLIINVKSFYKNIYSLILTAHHAVKGSSKKINITTNKGVLQNRKRKLINNT